MAIFRSHSSMDACLIARQLFAVAIVILSRETSHVGQWTVERQSDMETSGSNNSFDWIKDLASLWILSAIHLLMRLRHSSESSSPAEGTIVMTISDG